MENGTIDLAEQLNDEFTQAILPVTIIVGIEVVFGFVGNLLVIYVFLFHYRVCTFRYFVLCLAFIDITCCITTMSGEVVTQLYWYVYPVRELCKIKSFFNVFTVTAEALCLVTIALDRYRKVCRPFGWQLKPRVAIYLCVIYYIIALCVALPTPFFWGLHSETKIYRNTSITVILCEKDEAFMQTDYPMGYISSVGAIISVLLVLMFVQYVFVAIKLLKERQQRMKSGKPTTKTSSSTASTSHCTIATSGIRSTENTRSNDSAISVCDDKTDEIVTSAAFIESDIRTDKKETIHSEKPKKTKTRKQRATKREVAIRVRRNTLIMFILTLTFIVTTVLYFVLITFIASSKNILQYLSDGQKAVYFFFLRLYFINHIINPAVYGLLDPQFQSALRKIKKK
ncbi:type-1 angiotensin II receptor-like [Mercenaria mercenaria]|uniref:type-1 angiotensin II receptor-like n=1 Tax=Mercenaria mercenaria TaxID=6596 RepID=UPI00234EC0CF|nr:type-1 angiotensin II receptor-like [Mercenaria mercenaria]